MPAKPNRDKMKKLLATLILISIASPSFAEQKIRPSSFTPIEETNAKNPNIISREDYMKQRGNQLEQSKSQKPFTKEFNKRALNNKLNRSFGRDNVNATRTLWSNLNN